MSKRDYRLDGGGACTEWEPRLLGYLLGELGPEDETTTAAHLEVCTHCRKAVAEARRGHAALASLRDAPLPFADPVDTTVGHQESAIAWGRFLDRLEGKRSDDAVSFGRKSYRVASQMLAAAALVVMGIGMGRWLLPPEPTALPPSPTIVEALPAQSQEPNPSPVEELARADLLADLGVGYAYGLQDVLLRVMELQGESTSTAALATTRARALDLIRDGRFLRRNLDATRDREFLFAIDRAELILEEIAALGSGSSGTHVSLVQNEVRTSLLQDRLDRLQLEQEVDQALEASGRVGEEKT